GKPWVAAINGTCMGGAFELSLACHGRVAADSDKVKMALPEVKVGIFPGAGGTQRVPRLTDQQQALQMLTSGQNLSPQKAKAMGLIHEIARSEEHTSELQSREKLVCRLLLDNATAVRQFPPLSLHDALPIWQIATR